MFLHVDVQNGLAVYDQIVQFFKMSALFTQKSVWKMKRWTSCVMATFLTSDELKKGIVSLSFTMHVKGLSLQKWNTSHCVRIWGALSIVTRC